MNKAFGAFAIVALSVMIVSSSAFCGPGDLDPVFGVGGKIVVPNGQANAVAFDNEFGRDVIAGEEYFERGDLLIRVVRQLDPGFGHGGIVINPNQPQGAADVVLQPDLSIVTLGRSSLGLRDECSLSRYGLNGSPDTSFGGNGTVRRFISQFMPERLALQADGKYLVVGTAGDPFARNLKLTLVRFNSDGSLDQTFGDSGIVTTSFGETQSVYGFAVAVQSDDKIVVSGRAGRYPVVARFQTNGTLDSSFGSNGKVLFNAEGFDSAIANSLGIDALDGSIVFSATRSTFTTLVRLNPDGSFDASFNGNGRLKIPSFITRGLIIGNGGLGPLHQVALAGSVPRFVEVGGRSKEFHTFAVAMVLPNGTLEQAYGKNGIVTTPFTNNREEYSEARGIVFTESSGLAVAAGSTIIPAPEVDIARYLGE